MKKLAKLVMLTAMILFVCSCGNKGGQNVGNNGNDNNNSEEAEIVDEVDNHISYRLLGRHEYRRNPWIYLCDEWGNVSSSYFDDWFCDDDYSFDGLVICYDNKPLLFDDEEDYYNAYIHDWALAMAMASKLYKAEIRVVRPYKIIRFSDRQRFVLTPEGDTVIVQEEGRCAVNKNNDTIYTFVVRTDTISSFYADVYSIFDKNGSPINKGDTLKSWEFDKGRTAEYIMPYLNEYVGCLPECINSCKNEEIEELFRKTYYDLKEAGIYQPDKGYGYRKYPIDKDRYGYDYVELFRIDGKEYHDVPNGALGIRFKKIYW